MKILRLTHVTGGGTNCVYDATQYTSLIDEIDQMQYCEEGEEWKITVEEMPEYEFENLPEFTGW